jgi:hypothetical protein
LGGSLSVMVRY